MKILLAHDGSTSSATALRLVSSLPWPAVTEIEVITTLDTARLAGPWATMTSHMVADLQTDLMAELQAGVDEAVAALASTGARVSGHLLLGRPSAVIVDRAAEVGADLIVVGSRGQGALRTLLLGSVAAEVVDQARCPVLVARGPSVTHILVAHDGSDHARAAEDVVAAFAPLAVQPVEVVSVMRTHDTGTDVLAPAAMGRAMAQAGESMDEARRHHEDLARDVADRLARTGREATWTVRSGDPAQVLIDEADAKGADLIAMGTHGRTGLDRLVMGSVARKVLTHAHCSVLIVRAQGTAAHA